MVSARPIAVQFLELRSIISKEWITNHDFVLVKTMLLKYDMLGKSVKCPHNIPEDGRSSPIYGSNAFGNGPNRKKSSFNEPFAYINFQYSFQVYYDTFILHVFFQLFNKVSPNKNICTPFSNYRVCIKSLICVYKTEKKNIYICLTPDQSES